jgi:rhodanese-related sulfurtransferase
MPKSIDRNEVQRLINKRVQIVDVLPRKEYDYFHLPGAINLPLKSLNRHTVHQLQRETAVIVYCYDYQ